MGTIPHASSLTICEPQKDQRKEKAGEKDPVREAFHKGLKKPE